MVERRNLFINRYYKIIFIIIIFIIPLILSFSAKFIAKVLIDINFLNLSIILDNMFLENILEIFGIMIFSIIILFSVFIWSKQQYDLILNKIEIPCNNIINGHKPIPLKFRKGDLFISFGPTFNDFVNIFYNRKLHSDLLLKSLCHKIEQMPDKPTKEDAENLLTLFK